MTLTLHLGVLDIPYENAPPEPGDRHAPAKAPRMKKDGTPYKNAMKRAVKAYQVGIHAESGARTTFDVATFLEEKYHVFQTFYDLHTPEIVDIIGGEMNDRVEALMSGLPSQNFNPDAFIDPLAVLFNKFIDDKEMDGQPGVPTAASLRGRNLRFKKGFQPGIRPSFKNTGNYEDSMRSWIDAHS